MPDRRWRKIARDLWLHRARSMMVILAIVVGLVGAGAVLDTWALLRRVTREQFLATNPASATLRLAAGDSVDDALLAAVRAIPAVAEAQARRTVVASVETGGSWRPALLFASTSPATQRIGRLVRIEGQWPPADGAFVIEHSSVALARASVGDSVMLRTAEGCDDRGRSADANGDACEVPVRLPITGVARDAGLAPGWMENVVYAFVTPATLARLGAPATMDQLQIVVRDRSLSREAVREVARGVGEVVRRAGHRVRGVDVPEPGRHIHAGQMESLMMVQGAFGFLALLLSGFLVVNLVTAMLTGQLREIGVMKTIGARPSQLAGMYLGLALVLGVVASAVAIPIAAFIGRAYGHFAASLLNFDTDGVAIPRYSLVAQLLAGALLPVLAAAFPVLRGSRIPVAAALRDVGIEGAGATPRWLEHVRGPRRPILLSLRNAFRRRQRMALTLLTLALGGAVFVGALDLRAGIRASVGNLYGKLIRYDMVVRLDAPQPAARVEAIARGVAGVQIAEAWSGATAAMSGDEELGGSFAITALPSGSRLVAFPPERGRWLAGDDIGAMVVNARLLEERPSLEVGREVSLVVRGRSARWRIVGVVKSTADPTAYVTRSAFANPGALWAGGDTLARRVMIRASARDLGAQSDVVQRVREALEGAGLPVASSQLVEASRRAIENHLLMVVAFLVVMAQLTLVIGGLGLASTMSLAVLERTREIGVLRAIGATPGAIMRLVQVEGLVIALLSCLVAVPLSMPISVALSALFGRIMYPVPVSFVPQWGALAIWLGVAVTVSVTACAWPARRATRVPTAAALAYE